MWLKEVGEGRAAWQIQLINPLLWGSKAPSKKDAAPDKATAKQLNLAANSLQANSYTFRVKVSVRT